MDLATEVAREYHSGKLDPLMAMRIEKRKKKDGGKSKSHVMYGAD